MVRARKLKQLGVSQASLRVVSGPFQVVCGLPRSMAVSECLDTHMSWMVQPGIQKPHSLPRPGLGQHRTSLPPCSQAHPPLRGGNMNAISCWGNGHILEEQRGQESSLQSLENTTCLTQRHGTWWKSWDSNQGPLSAEPTC